MNDAQGLISFHYFRLSRHLWELMLTRMRQLGADTIFAPVPWLVHEFEAGQVDLKGITDSRRDLVGFIDLCQAMGFQLRLDLTPGFAADLNLLNNGVPQWLIQQHPEVRAKDAEGQPLPFCTVIHPTVQKFAGRWLTQLSEAIGPKLAPAGPLSAVQFDFRPPPGQFDYNEQIAKVYWPVWLRKRYVEGGIDAINEAYQPGTPFHSVSKVDLDARLASEVFEQDKQLFQAELNEQIAETYDGFLTTYDWPLVPAIEPPAHGFQVETDPIDVGISYQWAMDAPVQADGSLRHSFWPLKALFLEMQTDHQETGIQLIAADQAPLPLAENGGQLYRLLSDGLLLDQPKPQPESFSPTIADENGETDFYFTLAGANQPLSPFLNHYLQSLLAGQLETLRRCHQAVERLATALEPARPAQTSAPPPPLTEAQRSLQEASVALRRAAASIGALEDAFSTALDKPQLLAETPLLRAIDSSQLQPVHSACQAVMSALSPALSISLANPLTVNQYQVAYQQLVAAAESSIGLLDEQLRWLRQQLLAGTIASSARTVHAYLELLLKSLERGVLRNV